MTPNDIVEIKPTDGGWREIAAYVDRFNDHMRVNHPKAAYRMSVPNPDDDGYIKGQFWGLMRYFDWSRGAGCDIHFSDMRIPGAGKDKP